MFDKLEVNQGMLVENIVAQMLKAARSEERRVGKECEPRGICGGWAGP